MNYGGQLFGAGSRCFQLGRDWTKNDINGINGVYSPDAGCYMVYNIWGVKSLLCFVYG